MTITEYYLSLKRRPSPKQAFKDSISSACGVKHCTVIKWLMGHNTPNKLARDKIAEIAGLPSRELFPDIKD